MYLRVVAAVCSSCVCSNRPRSDWLINSAVWLEQLIWLVTNYRYRIRFVRSEAWFAADPRSIRTEILHEEQRFSCRQQLDISHCDGVRRHYRARTGGRWMWEDVWEREKINWRKRRELWRSYWEKEQKTERARERERDEIHLTILSLSNSRPVRGR